MSYDMDDFLTSLGCDTETRDHTLTWEDLHDRWEVPEHIAKQFAQVNALIAHYDFEIIGQDAQEAYIEDAKDEIRSDLEEAKAELREALNQLAETKPDNQAIQDAVQLAMTVIENV